MSQGTEERVRWTTADIELLPDNGNRYEIIDGELFVTKAPHWGHQRAIGNAYAELRVWAPLRVRQSLMGETPKTALPHFRRV